MEVTLKMLLTGLFFVITLEPNTAQMILEAFGKAAWTCFGEVLKLSTNRDLNGRLAKFWHPDEPLTNDMGCVFRCGLQQMNLLDSEDRINRANVREALMSKGTDTENATKFVTMLTDCRHKARAIGCEMAASTAECVRIHLYKWKWLPSPDGYEADKIEPAANVTTEANSTNQTDKNATATS